MTHPDFEALLDEIALSDDLTHLAQLQHVIARAHAGDPALGTLLEWIAARREMLERRRTRDPTEATARPYQRVPMSAELFEGDVGRIRRAQSDAELVTLVRGIQGSYRLDVRWPALRDKGKGRKEQIEEHHAARTERSPAARGTL